MLEYDTSCVLGLSVKDMVKYVELELYFPESFLWPWNALQSWMPITENTAGSIG